MSNIANHLSSITQTLERMRSGEKLEFISIVGDYYRAGLFAISGADEDAAVDAMIRPVMSAGVASFAYAASQWKAFFVVAISEATTMPAKPAPATALAISTPAANLLDQLLGSGPVNLF